MKINFNKVNIICYNDCEFIEVQKILIKKNIHWVTTNGILQAVDLINSIFPVIITTGYCDVNTITYDNEPIFNDDGSYVLGEVIHANVILRKNKLERINKIKY